MQFNKFFSLTTLLCVCSGVAYSEELNREVRSVEDLSPETDARFLLAPPVKVYTESRFYDKRIGETAEFTHSGLGSLPEGQVLIEIRENLPTPENVMWSQSDIAEGILKSLEVHIFIENDFEYWVEDFYTKQHYERRTERLPSELALGISFEIGEGVVEVSGKLSKEAEATDLIYTYVLEDPLAVHDQIMYGLYSLLEEQSHKQSESKQEVDDDDHQHELPSLAFTHVSGIDFDLVSSTTPEVVGNAADVWLHYRITVGSLPIEFGKDFVDFRETEGVIEAVSGGFFVFANED